MKLSPRIWLVLGLAPATLAIAWLVVLSQNTVAQRIRVATFNLALNRPTAEGLAGELGDPSSPQLRALQGIIQTVRADILVLNEFDYDGRTGASSSRGRSLDLFAEAWLGVDGEHSLAVEYPHRFTAGVNTGLFSGHDLDRDGRLGSAGDGFGYGAFPGQYGMALLSRYPILRNEVRSFQTFLWRDMPESSMPRDYYSSAEQEIFRLSSKSHWDIPIQVGDQKLHLLLCHPTPPVFDGPEDRNGRRNHDEIRFFADYIDPAHSGYIYDDRGQRGGLEAGAQFVICGDMNADPVDGDSYQHAIGQLLNHPLLNRNVVPSSPGSDAMSRQQGGKNFSQQGSAASDTGDFNDQRVGNLRLDYVLPSRNLALAPPPAAGVYWPAPKDPAFRRWIGEGKTVISSDHRCVWVDLYLLSR